MPVPLKEEPSDEIQNEKIIKTKSGRTSKQTTISSLFTKSAKRKKSNNDLQQQKKQKIDDENAVAGSSTGRNNITTSTSASNASTSPDNTITELKQESTEIKEKPTKKGIERCKECRQVISKDDMKMFEGDPDDAVEELMMLCDPRLSLLCGDEEQFNDYYERPQHKLTEFSVYDKCGHLAPFDTGLIEKNVELYFSGYVKPIYDETIDKEGGVCTKKMGPINEWWIAGFDGGENALIGFGTAVAEYVLVRPTDEYSSYMNAVAEKICMSKILIELIIADPEATYEELLNKIETTVPPENCSKLTEDSLLRHAQFLVEQVESYDSAASEYDEDAPLVAAMCVRDLIKLAGVTLGKRRSLRGVKVKAEKKALGPTLATTTPLVRYVFDTFFQDQLDVKGYAKRKRRCGVCDVCQQPDCGKCKACNDMIKFGGSGRAKQCCINRRCPNMAVQEAEENNASQDEDSDPILKSPLKEEKSPKLARKGFNNVTKTSVKWDCVPHMEKKNRKLYKSVLVNGKQVNVGDFVKVCPQNPTDPLYICQIRYMWEDFNGKKQFHAQWLYRSAETVLGETGDPVELFFCDDCDNSPLGSIMEKCQVTFKKVGESLRNEGSEMDVMETDDEHKELYVQKWYDIEDGCFLDVPNEFLNNDFDERYCPCCDREVKKRKFNTPTLLEVLDDQDEFKDTDKVLYKSLKWQDEVYSVGNCVYIQPDAYKFKKKKKSEASKSIKREKYEEETYPELYRKSNEYIKGNNADIAEPYRIGCILQIIQTKGSYGEDKNIMIKVRKYYRPENTHLGSSGTYNTDLNLLYWCGEDATIKFEDNVEGKCYVLYADDAEANVTEYTEGGPHRFFFKESYDAESEQFDTPSNRARSELSSAKSGKGKGKGKAKKGSALFQKNTYNVEFPIFEKVERLRTLDIFAGCGGLSEGLHQVGVADSRWAVEFEPSAAQAYRLNNPGAIVFNADCNNILKLVMEGRETDESGQRLPRKGEVDLLCGGPPCQGFSGMNRFNSREYSTFKCEFGVLQAGSYGVPQTRRRAILIAAAPGEVLPKYPEPQHVFSPKGLSLSVMIDEKKYQALKKLHTAPYRTITVRDAMSDLPEIKNGASKLEISYDSEPISHFQKMMRGKHNQQILRDHICKDMSPLVEARMRYIPCRPGSDWRNLPNIVVTLRDGTTTKKLHYLHDDVKQGLSESGELRGVCACASGTSCDPSDRQFNTLIPWCLPHTGNRHNHWAGLYGRLEWAGFFSTTVTNPEPMGKQGRVLHPEQHRVVSVRECARSQGFPDSVRFYGSTLDKHRQIGNAVAPPMAAAIGQEIRKALVKKQKLESETLMNIDENAVNVEEDSAKIAEDATKVVEDAVKVEEGAAKVAEDDTQVDEIDKTEDKISIS